MSAPENPPFHPLADVGVNGNELSFATSGGLTLRDWFAGQAFSGVMVNAQGLGDMADDERHTLLATVAKLIFEGADAMLAERAKGGVS